MLIDSNVLIDIFARDREWYDWSAAAFAQYIDQTPLIVNEIVYTEVSVRIETEAEMNAALADLGISFERIPQGALFLAGKAFRRYRQAGGTRNAVLADFFIGAHASVADIPILTRDLRRYRSYFPDVRLITPES